MELTPLKGKMKAFKEDTKLIELKYKVEVSIVAV